MTRNDFNIDLMNKLSIHEKAVNQTNSAFAIFDDNNRLDNGMFPSYLQSVPGGKTRADSSVFQSSDMKVGSPFNLGTHSLKNVKKQTKMRDMSHDVNRRNSFFSSGGPNNKKGLKRAYTRSNRVSARSSQKSSSRANSRSSRDAVSKSSKSTKSKRISKKKNENPFPSKPEKSN